MLGVGFAPLEGLENAWGRGPALTSSQARGLGLRWPSTAECFTYDSLVCSLLGPVAVGCPLRPAFWRWRGVLGVFSLR